jgi:hypothetical protein
MTAAVEDEELPVARPVGSLNAFLGLIDYSSPSAVRGDDLQTAFHGSDLLLAAGAGTSRDLNMTENRALQNVGVVRAHNQTYINGISEDDSGRPYGLELAVWAGHEECECVPPPFQPDGLRRRKRRANFLRRFTCLFSIL